jgi:hypothetical protein
MVLLSITHGDKQTQPHKQTTKQTNKLMLALPLDQYASLASTIQYDWTSSSTTTTTTTTIGGPRENHIRVQQYYSNTTNDYSPRIKQPSSAHTYSAILTIYVVLGLVPLGKRGCMWRRHATIIILLHIQTTRGGR